MYILCIIICLLSGLAAGYALGRSRGIKEGEQLEELYSPLLIRKESLERGQCVICNSSLDCSKPTSMLE